MDRVILNVSKAEAYTIMEALRMRTDLILATIQAQLSRQAAPRSVALEEKKPAVRAKATKRRIGRPRKNASAV